MYDKCSVIRQLITYIDLAAKKQLTAIIEDRDFKELLANWSCLYYLVQLTGENKTKIKILDLKWQEIPSLISNEAELGSIIAQKVFDEVDLPGNDPLSLIIGSYIIDASNKTSIEILSHFGELAAYSFAPFITSISASIFNAQGFEQMLRVNLENTHRNLNFKHLVELAKNDYTNFIGLVVPHVLFPSLINTNKYTSLLGADIKNYTNILGNGAYMFAALAIGSFSNDGWFLDIVGRSTTDFFNSLENQNILKLQANSFFAESYDSIKYVFFKYTTESFISEKQEKELADLGIMAICHIQNRDFARLYNANSLKILSSKTTHKQQIKIESSLQYILCVSRFAHYIKVIGRRKLGLYSNALELQDYLNNWLLQYIASDVETPLHLKRKYPLMEARVEIYDYSFLQDTYQCLIYMKPHLNSSQLSATIVLKTKLIKN